MKHQILMSALPPKADIRGGECDVRFVPIADIPQFIRSRGGTNHKPLLKMLMVDSSL